MRQRALCFYTTRVMQMFVYIENVPFTLPFFWKMEHLYTKTKQCCSESSCTTSSETHHNFTMIKRHYVCTWNFGILHLFDDPVFHIYIPKTYEILQI